MTYLEIIDAFVLALFLAFITGATLAKDPHKEMRRLAWAGLLLLAYISDKVQ
jgi:hypothetical protein